DCDRFYTVLRKSLALHGFGLEIISPRTNPAICFSVFREGRPMPLWQYCAIGLNNVPPRLSPPICPAIPRSGPGTRDQHSEQHRVYETRGQITAMVKPAQRRATRPRDR